MNKGLMVCSQILGTIKNKNHANFKVKGRGSTIRHLVMGSACGLILLSIAILAPVSKTNESAEAYNTAQAAPTLTIDVSNATAALDLTVLDDGGTFAESTDSSKAAFSVNTTNYTGYTLGITGSTTTLVNSDNSNYELASITKSLSATDFNKSAYNNMWGYMPSKYNSNANTTTYYPSPTSSSTTLDNRGSAGTSDYTIGVGARATYAKLSGAYINNYTLTAVINGFNYNIYYNKGNTTDTVNNLPATQSATSSSVTYITLDSTVPTRTGYTFSGWCEGTITTTDGVDSCTGTSYRTGASHTTNPTYYFDKAISNTSINLSAMWTINSYTQTVDYYCQSAAGAEGTKYTYTESVKYNSTFSFTSAKATSCYNSTYHSSTIYTSNTGTGTKTISYTVTSANTNVAYFHRNTRTITLAAGTGIGSVSASGTGVKSSSGNVYTVYYGGAVTLAATPSTGYSWLKWTNTSGGTDFSTTQGYSFSSVTSNYSLTANGQRTLYTVSLTRNGVKDVTFANTTTDTSRCPTRSNISATSTTLCYGVSYTITMTPNDNYEFESWATAANGTLGSTSSASTTYKVTGATTLTANAKSSAKTIANATYMQDVTSCPSTLTTGTQYTLKDSRDQKEYTVSKLADGKCWMTRNLNLAGSTKLESTKSDVPSGYTESSPYYTLPASSTSGFSSDTTAYVYNSNSTTCGSNSPCYSYYSWLAATAGGKDSSGNAVTSNGYNAEYSICPKGWKLPTSTTSNANAQSNNNWKTGDWYAFATAYGANLESNYYQSAATFYNNVNGGNAAGKAPVYLPLAGYYGDSSFYTGGSDGFYWSRTAYSSTYAYYLYFYSSRVYSANYSNRRFGFSVRCVFVGQ